MKALLGVAAILLVGFANEVKALDFLGDLSVPELMEKCQSAEGGSDAQLQCFEALALLLKQQENEEAASANGQSAIVQTLDALRTVAEYQDNDSGLSIIGEGCEVQVLYYGNYYRISRRNVSTIDLFSARFDASKIVYGQTKQVQSQSLTWARGIMEAGATAVSHGGPALESKAHGFQSKPASASLADYASEVVSLLPARNEQEFDFVLIHPKRTQSSNDIWKAFAAFAKACQK